MGIATTIRMGMCRYYFRGNVYRKKCVFARWEKYKRNINCDLLQIQVEEPRGLHPSPQRVAGGSTSHVFVAHPGQQWTIRYSLCSLCKRQITPKFRMRTVNSAGHSAWTAPATVKTPAAGEAIVSPTVSSHYHGFLQFFKSGGKSEDRKNNWEISL